MIRTLLVVAFTATAALAAGSGARAQGGPPDADDHRYRYNRVDEGYVRLDTRTGQVSLCSRNGTGWSCRLAPDDRNAFESEIERLQRENGQLKKALLDRGLPLPGASQGGLAESAPPRPPQDLTPRPGQPPSDAEVERALSFIEKVWRRLVEMMMNLQRDLKKSSALVERGADPS
jgi:hypothetical protein